jgi:cold shock CspA family protein
MGAVSLDDGFERAKALIAEVSPRIDEIKSEQGARFQIINRFLVEVLGWDFGDINTEPHSPNGYADYLVSVGGSAALVIEAKRTGNILVDTLSPKLAHYKVSGPALSSAADGFKQAISYSVDHGADLAALTTGLTWIGFVTFPGGGRSYRDCKATVFPTLEAIIENFATFYDIFSKKAVTKKLYKVHFAKIEGLTANNFEPMVPVNRQSELQMLAKTALAQDLDPIFKEFFGVLSGDLDKDMLLHCFVESRESRNADASLQKLIGTVAGQVATLTTATGAQLLEQIENAIDNQHGDNVLIVGNKGAGKSTFVERFFKLVLSAEFRSKCLLIKVDFLSSNGEIPGVVPWTTERVKAAIEAQLFKDSIATYDELQGLYFFEYKKWRDGQFKHLYDSDKTGFKIKFGEYLDSQITINPHQYILRLLHDVVQNRKLLPVFVFDNTDHHPEGFQEAVFQWTQSIRAAVPVSLVILPITDRTIWKMSKHGPFQTYDSKLFYLPVPSTKEVLEKRISYLQDHAKKGAFSRKYFSDRGVRLSVENINLFAACTEEIFIREDFISKRIGWLSNHDIRRGLVLSKKVITSPFLNIDELMSAYMKRMATGENLVVHYPKFMQALVLGDYNHFQQGESPFVINIFEGSTEFPASPLLRISILKLLIDKAGEGDGLAGYIAYPQLATYFDAMGASVEAVQDAVSALLDYRLIEPFDASSRSLGSEQRVAVTHSGRMHVEMAVSDPLYVSQMAFATPLRSASVVERLRGIKQGQKAEAEWEKVRKTFLLYCFAQDRTYMRVPRDAMFAGQHALRKDLSVRWAGGGVAEPDQAVLVKPDIPDATRSHVRGVVKWFDPVKGFGFVDAGLGADAFLHVATIQRAGFQTLGLGDYVVCDVGPGKDGKAQVIHVHSVEPVEPVDRGGDQLVPGEILFYNPQKGFGFVRAEGFEEDVYISAAILQGAGLSEIGTGSPVRLAVSEYIRGRGRSARFLELA